MTVPHIKQIKSHTMLLYFISFVYLYLLQLLIGDRGSTVVKVLCYKSEGRWSLEFFIDKIFPIALRPWGRINL